MLGDLHRSGRWTPRSTGPARATPTPSSTPTRPRRPRGSSRCSTSCPALVDRQTDGETEFFLNFAITLQKPEPPQSIKDELVKQQAARRRRPGRPGRGRGPRGRRAGPGRGREGRGAEDPGPGRRARPAGLPAAVRHRPRAEPVPALHQQPDHRRRRTDHRPVGLRRRLRGISRLAGLELRGRSCRRQTRPTGRLRTPCGRRRGRDVGGAPSLRAGRGPPRRPDASPAGELVDQLLRFFSASTTSVTTGPPRAERVLIFPSNSTTLRVRARRSRRPRRRCLDRPSPCTGTPVAEVSCASTGTGSGSRHRLASGRYRVEATPRVEAVRVSVAPRHICAAELVDRRDRRCRSSLVEVRACSRSTTVGSSTPVASAETTATVPLDPSRAAAHLGAGSLQLRYGRLGIATRAVHDSRTRSQNDRSHTAAPAGATAPARTEPGPVPLCSELVLSDLGAPRAMPRRRRRAMSRLGPGAVAHESSDCLVLVAPIHQLPTQHDRREPGVIG